MIRIVFTALLLLLSACAEMPEETSASYAVAMPDAYAAEIAADILSQGGNAVDAAVAVGFSLAVTLPEAGNIGGGGFMTLYMDGEPLFLDYRETAPLSATETLYQDENGTVIEGLSTIGALAAGVPGTVKGLWAAHQRYGTLDWADLLAPAIRLAEEGFEVHPVMAANIARTLPRFEGKTNFAATFGDVQAGTVFKQPDLATALKRIADKGPDGFYKGETARLLTEQMAREGGIITQADLDAYQPVWRAPIVADWRDMRVVTAPPPSSGGVALMQLLHGREVLSEKFGPQTHNSAAYIHLKAEAEKQVFADRAQYLGDPDFVDVPVTALIAPAYTARRLADVRLDTISPTDTINPGLESEDTTHFAIVDAQGNAVSNTYTLNGSFGSGVVVEGAGILLNNEMDDFSAKPGVPNFYGVIGGAANAIAPGKRMLSSMTPTIVLKGGEVLLVAGTPGGSTIFTTVYQLILNHLDYGMGAKEAVRSPRIHHQLYPEDTVFYEEAKPLPVDVIAELEGMGYTLTPRSYPIGDAKLIIRAPDGELSAGADDRFRGAARTIAN